MHNQPAIQALCEAARSALHLSLAYRRYGLPAHAQPLREASASFMHAARTLKEDAQ